MNRKPRKGLLKHIDFIIVDIISLVVSYVIAYWIISGFGYPFERESYFYLFEVLIFAELITILVSNAYDGVLRRGRYDELISVIKFAIYILAITLTFLFAVHQTIVVSRLQAGWTLVIFIVVDFLLRYLEKKIVFGLGADKDSKRGKSIVLITSSALVDEAMSKLMDPNIYKDYFISGVLLLDEETGNIKGDYDLTIIPLGDESIERLRNKWVDEVFILQPKNYILDEELMAMLIDMGLTVNICPEILYVDTLASIEMRKLGKYRVLTSSINSVTANKMIMKRIMDVIGGLFGCLLTGILFVFIAPLIYVKSPGPIFYTQERIGLNGRVFKIYKFRSMYMDADERKKDLMENNKISDERMFKLDDDPRIIGSEKKNKKGEPKGIGNFIRKTSIDEFPQFFNVVKGDMSLVGTRPPLVSEWEKYDIHHRARMTVKPGITGLWQVSGRSEIVDFEEVVSLDKEYVENWSISLDIKIILKTIVVVLARRGAE